MNEIAVVLFSEATRHELNFLRANNIDHVVLYRNDGLIDAEALSYRRGVLVPRTFDFLDGREIKRLLRALNIRGALSPASAALQKNEKETTA